MTKIASLIALSFLVACGDKDEDTAEAAEDTSAEEAAEETEESSEETGEVETEECVDGSVSNVDGVDFECVDGEWVEVSGEESE